MELGDRLDPERLVGELLRQVERPANHGRVALAQLGERAVGALGVLAHAAAHVSSEQATRGQDGSERFEVAIETAAQQRRDLLRPLAGAGELVDGKLPPSARCIAHRISVNP